MERKALLQWLQQHPESVHGDPAVILSRCDREVRKHAQEHAWLAAKAYTEDRMHEWEHAFGFHSSEAYAAREACAQLANALKRREPHLEAGHEAEFAGPEQLAALEPDARERVEEWIRELADGVEHRIWKEIVRYTRKRGRKLARDEHLSRETSWEGTEDFPSQAARIAKLLVDDFEQHAHPPRS